MLNRRPQYRPTKFTRYTAELPYAERLQRASDGIKTNRAKTQFNTYYQITGTDFVLEPQYHGAVAGTAYVGAEFKDAPKNEKGEFANWETVLQCKHRQFNSPTTFKSALDDLTVKQVLGGEAITISKLDTRTNNSFYIYIAVPSTSDIAATEMAWVEVGSVVWRGRYNAALRLVLKPSYGTTPELSLPVLISNQTPVVMVKSN